MGYFFVHKHADSVSCASKDFVGWFKGCRCSAYLGMMVRHDFRMFAPTPLLTF